MRGNGEKSRLEDWKTVTLHLESRNALTKKNKGLVRSEGEAKTKKEVERRSRVKSKRGGLRRLGSGDGLSLHVTKVHITAHSTESLYTAFITQTKETEEQRAHKPNL